MKVRYITILATSFVLVLLAGIWFVIFTQHNTVTNEFVNKNIKEMKAKTITIEHILNANSSQRTFFIFQDRRQRYFKSDMEPIQQPDFSDQKFSDWEPFNSIKGPFSIMDYDFISSKYLHRPPMAKGWLAKNKTSDKLYAGICMIANISDKKKDCWTTNKKTIQKQKLTNKTQRLNIKINFRTSTEYKTEFINITTKPELSSENVSPNNAISGQWWRDKDDMFSYELLIEDNNKLKIIESIQFMITEYGNDQSALFSISHTTWIINDGFSPLFINAAKDLVFDTQDKLKYSISTKKIPVKEGDASPLVLDFFDTKKQIIAPPPTILDILSEVFFKSPYMVIEKQCSELNESIEKCFIDENKQYLTFRRNVYSGSKRKKEAQIGEIAIKTNLDRLLQELSVHKENQLLNKIRFAISLSAILIFLIILIYRIDYLSSKTKKQNIELAEKNQRLSALRNHIFHDAKKYWSKVRTVLESISITEKAPQERNQLIFLYDYTMTLVNLHTDERSLTSSVSMFVKTSDTNKVGNQTISIFDPVDRAIEYYRNEYGKNYITPLNLGEYTAIESPEPKFQTEKVNETKHTLYFIIENLIKNAIQEVKSHQHREPIRSWIKCETSQDHKNSTVEIGVWNQISEPLDSSRREKIFKYGNTFGEHQGNGFGLYFCKLAVIGLGGKIYAKNETRQNKDNKKIIGITLTVKLPATVP